MWYSAEVAGKPVDVFDPPTGARSALLFLHAGDLITLRDNPVYTPILNEFGMACACPHGGWSWWADRICPEFDPASTPERHLLDDVIPFMRDRWSLGERSIAVAGISMGGQGALRIGFKHPDLFPVVVGVASSIDHHEWYGRGTALDSMYDSQEQCRQDTATLHVHPSKSPRHVLFVVDPDDAAWFRGNDRLHEKLRALGVPHECDLSTRAGGHSWDYFNHMAGRVIRFCAEGLREESRRLL